MEKWNFKSIERQIEKLKYLNKQSAHTNANFNTIPSCIFKQLAKLTSKTKKNTQMKIDGQYPLYANALIKYVLDPKVFSSLNKVWKKAGISKFINGVKRKTRSGGGHNTYFCVRFSDI